MFSSIVTIFSSGVRHNWPYSEGVSLWFFTLTGASACYPGGKQRPVKPTFLPILLLTVLSDEKGLSVKGQ
jgi:hypothetical protein